MASQAMSIIHVIHVIFLGIHVIFLLRIETYYSKHNFVQKNIVTLIPIELGGVQLDRFLYKPQLRAQEKA